MYLARPTVGFRFAQHRGRHIDPRHLFAALRQGPEKQSDTAAEIQRFLSIAAGQVAFGPAAARLVNVFGAALDHQRAIEIAHGVLSMLDDHLDGRNWLVGSEPTIADVANYAYIAHAPEGDVALDNYPNVRAWLARIAALPGFVPMQATAVGLAA